MKGIIAHAEILPVCHKVYKYFLQRRSRHPVRNYQRCIRDQSLHDNRIFKRLIMKDGFTQRIDCRIPGAKKVQHAGDFFPVGFYNNVAAVGTRNT